ncbi:hypothetical protein JCGZ_09209 [Jatropha curcas]|uniref:Uncharacterized protein n=1 Tax=Jatropha curcas TaxID=180498 RepID=A0A067KFB6_JATCU|nr:hypothetical protein JCGZ_09209 [Jatropha curcas]
MWPNHERNVPTRGFSTPPASWDSQHSPVAMPVSERKNFPLGCKRDLFHVVHKVPAGDSPYVRAKHVQLIDKDPSRAISLFWAAINSGDRVDSALKDMAVVMKQLNRSDEAIEAIKSFRHLCPYDSQESLDNVLVELYKRSGRVEEEIEMLQRRLKNIEEGIAFGGKRTKTARSQGRKVQITIEQERSRILGNLAWAYLQHHDYGLAEQHYRKALLLEPDKNKQCNLAICLMHMNRIPEAKSLIQAVKASCRGKQMDESYAKSFERAVEILAELESKSMLKPAEENQEDQRSSAARKLKVTPSSTEGGQGYNIPGFKNSRKQEKFSSQQSEVDNGWSKSNYCESPGERSCFSSKMKENWIGFTEKELGYLDKKTLASPAAVLYTQPRRIPWRFGEGDQREVKWEEHRIRESSKNVLSNTIRNLDSELDSTKDTSVASLSKSKSNFLSPLERNWRGSTGVVMFSQPRAEGHRRRTYTGDDDTCLGKNSSTNSANKSWADIVEEEENQKLLTGKDLSPCFDDTWGYENEYNDENQDSNIIHNQTCPKSPVDTITEKLEACDIKDGYNTFNHSVSPRNPTARRSLCFNGNQDYNMRKKNRLQVFRDITSTLESP